MQTPAAFQARRQGSVVPTTPPPRGARSLRSNALRLGAVGMVIGLFLGAARPAHSRPAAVVVAGLSANQSDADALHESARLVAEALQRRGIASHDIAAMGWDPHAEATRAGILHAIANAASAVGEGEEFWLILFGHCAPGRTGAPAFQVKGPRLTASDLVTALPAVPGVCRVVVGAELSGGFLTALSSIERPPCWILTTALETHEPNAQRFPAHWARALASEPRAAFGTLAQRAATTLQEELDSLSLARGETAQLWDPLARRIVATPFNIVSQDNLVLVAEESVGSSSHDAAPSDPPAQEPSVEPLLASDLSAPSDAWIVPPLIATGTATVVDPDNAASRDILTAAHSCPNPGRAPVIVLREDRVYTVNADRSTVETVQQRVFFASAQGIDAWANRTFPALPPAVVTRLLGARLIRPDGSSVRFPLVTLLRAAETASGGGAFAPVSRVVVPGVVAGCVLELAWRTDAIASGTSREFYAEFPLQQAAPVLDCRVTLRVPKRQPWFHVVRHCEPPPPQDRETAHSRERIWHFQHLPALAPLPNDPPLREFAAWMGVSSMKSWEDFDAYYMRLAEGADVPGPKVEALARRLVLTHPTRRDRIRAVWDEVRTMRYLPPPCQIHGFRAFEPDTVLERRFGDCKDKANLAVALLRAMGIPARFALINRFDWTDVGFPGWQFNHALAYVPPDPEAGQPDPLWLDITEQASTFGVLAPGNAGRAARVFHEGSGEFITVKAPASTTELRDRWDLTCQPDGTWAGRFERSVQGAAEFDLRSMIETAADPLQWQAHLAATFDVILPHADFVTWTVSRPDPDARGSGVPLILGAVVTNAAAPWPGLDRTLFQHFALPTRDRPLLLNDRQPFAVEQILRVRLSPDHFAHWRNRVATSPPWAPITVAGLHLSLTWTVDEATLSLERRARVALSDPVIATPDYLAARSALRDWDRALRAPLTWTFTQENPSHGTPDGT